MESMRAAGRRARLLGALALAAAGLALWAGPGAGAHALVASSDPPAGATLGSPPSQIVLTFTEQPDLHQSLIQLLDSSGKQVAGGHPVQVAGQPPTVVRIPVATFLAKGVYAVSWKSISVVDGHLATGAFSFGVGEAPRAATSGTVVKSTGPSELGVVSRWLYLVGLIELVGLAFTELVVLAGTVAPRRLRLALGLSWVAAAAGLLGLTQAQRSGAGLSLGGLLSSSSIGHAFILRAVPLVVAGAALLLVKRAGRSGVGAVGLAALAAMLADVLKSHAAASAGWIWFRIGTQWVHFVAAGIWIGGLTGLLLCLVALGPGNRRPAARRFSFYAGIAIAVVGVTGTLRALDEVGSWHLLLHTGSGQVVVVKIALFGVLAALGAVNRFRNVPAVEDSPRGLARTGRAELVAMAAILAATGLLQNLAPARTQAASNAAPTGPITVDTQDFAQTYRLHLVISPGTAGFNQFTLGLTDYQTGKPTRADGASLTFHYPDKPSFGDSTLALAPQRPGTFAGRSANMSLQGRWTLTVLVSNGLRSVNVPIDVVTLWPPEPTKSQTFVGSPTVYTVSLPGSRQLQIYSDPIRLGKAEFHATFIDGTTGQELKMATFAVTAARSPGGSNGALLTFRKLDDLGHFVADGPGRKGTYTFNVAGTTTDGDVLGATITVPIA
jgi:copper transport protein